MKHVVSIVISLMVVISSQAQDIEQLTKSDPVAWSGGLTWSNIFTWPKDSARQVPTYSYYISGSLNTTVFGVVSLPISFAYTNNKLSSTITYPFNHFSLTPSYKSKKLDFPMLCAKPTLDETSTISLKMGDGGVYPKNANGLLSVEAPMGKDTASSKQ